MSKKKKKKKSLNLNVPKYCALTRRMASTIWDYCYLDTETLKVLEDIKDDRNSNPENFEGDSQNASSIAYDSESNKSNSEFKKKNSLVLKFENKSKVSLEIVDLILEDLNYIGKSYSDVSSRTSSLMLNSENLLEQQVIFIL